MKAIITFNIGSENVVREISDERYSHVEEFKDMIKAYAKVLKRNIKADGFEVEFVANEIVSHTIPPHLLHDFSFNGNGQRLTHNGTYSINGLDCLEWIKAVEYHGQADKLPIVTITGRLSRLDDERKKSWGIDL